MAILLMLCRTYDNSPVFTFGDEGSESHQFIVFPFLEEQKVSLDPDPGDAQKSNTEFRHEEDLVVVVLASTSHAKWMRVALNPLDKK